MTPNEITSNKKKKTKSMTLYILKSIGLYLLVAMFGWMTYQVSTKSNTSMTIVMLIMLVLIAVFARLSVKQMKKELEEDRR